MVTLIYNIEIYYIEGRSTTIISEFLNDRILYSLFPNKYRETEGIKDIGTQFWNQGRTEEIKERVLHL